MTSTKRLFRHPLAATLALLLLISGCATDPNAGAQSAGIKVSTDPCARTATVVGGAPAAVASGASGVATAYNTDQRRCALFAIAKEHNAEVTIASVIVPKGELPAAAAVAATPAASAASSASATPFAAGSDTATAGLSVTLRDNGSQFAAGSDRLTPEAESLFRDLADPYSYPRQSARLTATSTEDEKAAVEALKTRRILLVGHTDDTGGSTDNANLSERRAAAVARVFQGQGVAAANLYFQGAGETLPIADNHTEAGRTANRRIEIVDLTDADAFHKFLATRRQTLQYYRASDTPVAEVVATPPVPTRGRKAAKANTGFVDFGGVPAATLASSPDFASGTVLVATPGAGTDRPIVPTCNVDRPRVANSVKSLATQRELAVSDYVPGLYNTSWSDTVNGNLIGLTNVDVLRDGGAAAGKPTLLIWKNYNARKKMPPADFQATPDVNVYRGSHAILYRVFVGGPVKCMDVLFPYTDTGESRNSSLFYDRQSAMYVSSFELKSLSGGSAQ